MNYSVVAQTQKSAPPQLNKNNVKEVVAAMTLQEKVSLIVGMGMKVEGLPPGILPPSNPNDDKVAEKVPGAAGRTHVIARLGIPSITLSDGPAGVRINPIRNQDSSKTFYATAFPVATLLASSWDVDLVKKVGVAFGQETLDYGIDVLLAPGMNIQRNPLGGRNFEYYSEDPIVAGKMAAAFVRGVQSQGVGTSVKHFAANNQEFNRMQSNTIVSERVLREIYLKGFSIAVKEAKPLTVMTSYNKINGTYASESKDLLTTVLRKEWGFKGFVMTDWYGGKDAAAQMNAGNDVLMPGTSAQTQSILEGTKQGKISVKQLDENVARILNVMVQLPSFKQYKYSNQPDLKGHALTARMAAADGMVLLKNESNTLPLANTKKLALFGNPSYQLIAGGTGSGDVNKAYTVTIQQGLMNAGFALDMPLAKVYKTYIAEENAKKPKSNFIFFSAPPIPEMSVQPEVLAQSVAASDAAIITIGRNAGEGGDRKVENDFNLSAAESAMIKQVSAAYHADNKKVIVLLNMGGVTEVVSWRDQADAILLAWQPGQEGGNAIADLLNGKVNPSGKLAATFPVTYTDVPSAKTFPGKELPVKEKLPDNPLMGKPAEVVYDEGIYVGYRYYNTFKVKPAYEFGYGLSYTNFTYSNLKLSSPTFNNSLTVTVDLTNTGKIAGKEVVQLYLTAPSGSLDKPESELKGFAKTRLLKPGEVQHLSFTIVANDLASYDSSLSAWVADAGAYTVKIGASSLNIKQSGAFNLDKKLLVEQLSKVLSPTVSISEIKK